MAHISPSITRQIGEQKDGSVYRVIWTPVTNADTCWAVCVPEFSDKTIQVYGTFGSATMTVLGACDGVVDANGVLTNGFGLRNTVHSAISLTSAGGEAILENTEHVQPSLNGGDGTQALTVAMTVHMGNPLRGGD